MAFGALSVKGRALRYLAQREHSRAELERKLARAVQDLPEASAQAQISAALDELAAKGLLSEERTAQSVLLSQGRRFGTRRLRQTLQAKGLAPDLVADTLQQARGTELERARPMKIHEYQAKELLRAHGVPVPRGYPAFNVREAQEAAQKLGGRSGWSRPRSTPAAAARAAASSSRARWARSRQTAGQILGMQLKTHQTGPEGQKVRRLLHRRRRRHQEGVLRRRAHRPRHAEGGLMASSEGGMDIEEVAHSTPEKILKVFVDPLVGLTDAQALKICRGIGVPAAAGPGRGRAQEALHLLHGDRRQPGRDQPADPAKATATSRRWTPSSTSTPTRCSATPRSWPTATWTKKTRPRSRPASST
jgi:SOS response regulatory protein OraA/RecX